MSLNMSRPAINFKNHYFVIDFLKTIAVQIIILHHLSNYGPIPLKVHEIFPNFIDFIGEYGRYAVQIFLVIGGYLSVKNLPQTLEKQGVLKTIFNRYLRLIPTYAIAIIFTMVCATIARLVHYEEYIGEPETLLQILSHLLFLQNLLGYDSISVGVWYVAIDWQLYIFVSCLLFFFKSYQNILLMLTLFIAASLLYFSRHAVFENYFFYFAGAYGLGIIAFLAEGASHPEIKTPARLLLLIFSILIISDTFFEISVKNIIEMIIALILSWKGKNLYRSETFRWTKLCIWFSQRAYCAFLIHFSLILLGNTMFYRYHLESPLIALMMMVAIWLLSWVFAHVLYLFVEFPSRKIQLR
jgi:peptidoglycan/LPS O-acetylase OafA/YrhL